VSVAQTAGHQAGNRRDHHVFGVAGDLKRNKKEGEVLMFFFPCPGALPSSAGCCVRSSHRSSKRRV
jgi:hypothetical protein